MQFDLFRALAAGPLLALLFLAVGCAEQPAAIDAPPPDSAAVPAGPVAQSGPPIPYRVEGACPFECCTYGTWSAEQPLTVYTSAGDTSSVAFTIPAGTSFEADTGYVNVTQTGLVVIEQSMDVYRSYDETRTVSPGDTLYLLDYVGEGFYNAWIADSLYQIEPANPNDPAYRTLRDPEQTWWAHAALADGREGWLWMDENGGGAIGGYDACGLP